MHIRPNISCCNTASSGERPSSKLNPEAESESFLSATNEPRQQNLEKCLQSLDVAGNATMDTIYPEPMSLLHRRVVPKKRRGKSSRYRTQPVTFSEIQEVDEDNLEEGTETTAAVSTRSEQDINRRFEEFMKSREKILSQIEKSTTVTEENLNSTATNKENSCTVSQSNRFTPRPSI